MPHLQHAFRYRDTKQQLDYIAMNHSFLFPLLSLKPFSTIGGFLVKSSLPCRRTKTKDLSLAPFVCPPAIVHNIIVICVSIPSCDSAKLYVGVTFSSTLPLSLENSSINEPACETEDFFIPMESLPQLNIKRNVSQHISSPNGRLHSKKGFVQVKLVVAILCYLSVDNFTIKLCRAAVANILGPLIHCSSQITTLVHRFELKRPFVMWY